MPFLKNTADSPRGVMTASGLVMIDAGAVESVELSPKERASLGSFFRIVKQHPATEVIAAAKAHAENNLEQLRVIAEQSGVEVNRRWKEARLRSEIEKARAGAED